MNVPSRFKLTLILFSLLIHKQVAKNFFTNKISKNLNIFYSGGADYTETQNEIDYEDEERFVSVQYMITNRMRRILTDELGYLTSEVDIMAPEVAAVVIERNLSRPSKGMPISWRQKRSKGENLSKFFSPLKRRSIIIINHLQSSANTIKNIIFRKEAAPILLLLSVIILRSEIIWLGRKNLSILRSITKSCFRPVSILIRRFKKLTIRPKRPSIDLVMLDSLQNPSWFEKIAIKLKKIQKF